MASIESAEANRTARSTHLKLLDSMVTNRLRTSNLDNILLVRITKLIGIGRCSNLVVRPRSGELNLSAGLLLQLCEGLSAVTDEDTMVLRRDYDTDDDALPETSDHSFELDLNLLDEPLLASNGNVFTGRMRATIRKC